LTDITVDTGVMMSASGLGAPEHATVSLDFLQLLECVAGCHLVVDSEGMILYQYESKMDAGTFARQWLRRMFERQRVTAVQRASLDRGTSTRLRECHLDPEDLKYFVRTAAASRSKRLVSHDPDYSTRVKRVLRDRLDVQVLLQHEAHALLDD
jgi:hypothetical protein